MTASLYMIELRPDPAALIRFAQDQGLNTHQDQDLGYATHAWLKALCGELAPKPFRLLQDGRNLRPPRLLGFSAHDGTRLTEHARAFASPLAAQVCSLADGIAFKPMPESWPNGRKLGFEVMACPISRLGRNEDDVYRRHLRDCDARAQSPDSREMVYRRWLTRQFGSAATLDDFSLDGFRYLRLLRKARGTRSGFLAPQALFRGTLSVRDGAGFGALLARGIGRHRAFGFGMLLLRPAP
ncbi:CRISPR-associated protein, CT1974 family [Methylococcus capsulatus str. Bath]|uniref:CRISPR-associated protein, CT1974 family n=1 Tax=Methylococcus capsulatus (strain ATCC 33009 / NCIMB 11132 / Bath) TaxID=243233 RepID=Q60AD3_METCA|nr:type I-E CRISPR-associated protein Cas6/Cse3/CasE [Methylococcus capsulatus]AAU92788.1 CRISPR-associated protein, CT1974 family [Methylococcus capsulatus str. Bath]